MIDTTHITLYGGKGGNGRISFRRERFIPRGGPDGGDGGHGGDVYVRGNSSSPDLTYVSRTKTVSAQYGANGSTRNKHGANGAHLFLDVPLGTTVSLESPSVNLYLGEVTHEGQHILVSRGGSGGRGNPHFASASGKTPYIAEEGERGEARDLFLELCTVADVGLIGHPNSGKSLFLKQVSRAKPTVGDYPFTTTTPHKAVVGGDETTTTLVEMPGLIKGADKGKGLGNTFLRHLTRVRLILHVVDGSCKDPIAAIKEVNKEIQRYNSVLLERPQIVVITRADLQPVRNRIPLLQEMLQHEGIERHFISSATGEGIPALMEDVKAFLKKARTTATTDLPKAAPLPQHRHPARPSVIQREGIFVVLSHQAERLVNLPDLRQFHVRLQLRKALDEIGVVGALEEAGAQHGDRVRIGGTELQWE